MRSGTAFAWRGTPPRGVAGVRLLAGVSLAAMLASGVTAGHAAVAISSGATQNMSCTAGVCAPTATDAVLNVSDLENLLASGNVLVTTTGSGVQATDIVVKAALAWSATNTLSLDADRSITMDQPVSVQGLSGLTLTSDDGGKNGTLSFGRKGNVTFANLSSSLTLNGAACALVDSIDGLGNAMTENPDGCFALAASIDAGGTTYQGPVLGTLEGTLEGLGNTISHLTIKGNTTKGANIGLFEGIAFGTVENLRLVNADVRGEANHQTIGILAAGSDGLLRGVFATGRVKGEKWGGVGGLVGFNGGTIDHSDTSVTTLAEGGGVGAGGLVAENEGLIVASFATGSVTGTGDKFTVSAGGLVSANYGTISGCYATGAVTGSAQVLQSQIGGLVSFSSGSIVNSYATGAVTAGNDSNVGGLLGGNEGTIADSYSDGAVTAGASSNIGGLIGWDESSAGSLINTYWDTDSSGITNLSQGAGNIVNDPGITGLSTAQMQSGLPAGFDHKIWNEKFNVDIGLPYLLAIPPKK